MNWRNFLIRGFQSASILMAYTQGMQKGLMAPLRMFCFMESWLFLTSSSEQWPEARTPLHFLWGLQHIYRLFDRLSSSANRTGSVCTAELTMMTGGYTCMCGAGKGSCAGALFSTLTSMRFFVIRLVYMDQSGWNESTIESTASSPPIEGFR